MNEFFANWDMFTYKDSIPIIKPTKTKDTSYYFKEDVRAYSQISAIADTVNPISSLMHQFTYHFLIDFPHFTLPIETTLFSTVDAPTKSHAYTPLDPKIGHHIDVENDYDQEKRQQVFDSESNEVLTARHILKLGIQVKAETVKLLHPKYVKKGSYLDLFDSEFFNELKRLRVYITPAAPIKPETGIDHIKDESDSPIQTSDLLPTYSYLGFPSNTSVFNSLYIREFYIPELGPMPPISSHYGTFRGLNIFLPDDLNQISTLDAHFYLMQDSEIEAEGIYKLKD